MKLRIDGKEHKIKIEKRKYKNLKEMLRIVEFKYLFPERVIKSIEVEGKAIHPEYLGSLNDVTDINIITDSTVNFLKNHIELSIIALDSVNGAIEMIIETFEASEDLAKLHINYIADSVMKTVEILEKGSVFLPIVEGTDEAILEIEEKILRLNEIKEADEMVKFLESDFIKGVERWKTFLVKILSTINNSSMETH
ncbi:hypothetical protein [Desulfurobacterium indicum]|uniref:Uncharacterized protein n=1 Tax=Desulfurobacterium indicum TaxID=1914305 RepID=A0A1R1ML28_9BACT|nr:hypothetical protein [Desulfurobacterium indicum]OMH40518.1 hypothetical protein BLW93_04730 [Desulfurobacterium indicum]